MMPNPIKKKFIFGERERFMLLLMAPAAVLLILFQIVPIAIGLNVSFRDWALYNPKETWIGLKHYITIFQDSVFINTVIPNTFIFMFGSVSISLVLGLLLALLLNRKVRGQKIIQTVLLMPLMVAPVRVQPVELEKEPAPPRKSLPNASVEVL